jgi:DNA gyrase subunit B
VVRDIESLEPGPAGEPSEPRIERELSGEQAGRAASLLERLAKLVGIAERRGVSFADLLGSRRDGVLPTHRVSWRGGEVPAWSEAEALTIVDERGLRLGDASDQDADGGGPPIAAIRELHENRELDRVIAALAGLGLDITDYALVQEESVTGARLPARFAWMLEGTAEPESAAAAEAEDDQAGDQAGGETARPVVRSGSRVIEAANLARILPALHEVGRRGIEIKRFKGLGEMDAEQLWDTTMDPTRRMLLRVTWDMAGRAENLFSTLMGEEVEPRRKFIEDHALEVKHLDV